MTPSVAPAAVRVRVSATVASNVVVNNIAPPAPLFAPLLPTPPLVSIVMFSSIVTRSENVTAPPAPPVPVSEAPPIQVMLSFSVIMSAPVSMVTEPASPPILVPLPEPPVVVIASRSTIPLTVVIFTAPPAEPTPEPLLVPVVTRSPKIVAVPDPVPFMAIAPETVPAAAAVVIVAAAARLTSTDPVNVTRPASDPAVVVIPRSRSTVVAVIVTAAEEVNRPTNCIVPVPAVVWLKPAHWNVDQAFTAAASLIVTNPRGVPLPTACEKVMTPNPDVNVNGCAPIRT